MSHAISTFDAIVKMRGKEVKNKLWEDFLFKCERKGDMTKNSSLARWEKPGEKSQDFHFVEYVEEYELRDFDQIAFEKKNSKRFYFFIGSFQKYAVATESIDSWFSLTKSFNKRWNISRINTAFISPLRIEWVWRFIYYERSRERVRGGEVDSGRELCMIEREGEKEQEREREQTSEERHKRGLTRKHIML